MEVRSTLPDELLMYADKLSMAHSLELRVPYLDKDIVEYAESLAANSKGSQRRRKVASSAGVPEISSGSYRASAETWLCHECGGRIGSATRLEATMAGTFADDRSAIYQIFETGLR